MTRTNEQREYRAVLREGLEAAGLDRVRVVDDVEGFSMVPGRYGQVEYYGAEWGTGERRYRVYTAARRKISELMAIPGVRMQQRGDDEARMWFPVGDAECLRAVCGVIRARVRRSPTAPVPTGVLFPRGRP